MDLFHGKIKISINKSSGYYMIDGIDRKSIELYYGYYILEIDSLNHPLYFTNNKDGGNNFIDSLVLKKDIIDRGVLLINFNNKFPKYFYYQCGFCKNIGGKVELKIYNLKKETNAIITTYKDNISIDKIINKKNKYILEKIRNSYNFTKNILSFKYKNNLEIIRPYNNFIYISDDVGNINKIIYLDQKINIILFFDLYKFINNSIKIKNRKNIKIYDFIFYEGSRNNILRLFISYSIINQCFCGIIVKISEFVFLNNTKLVRFYDHITTWMENLYSSKLEIHKKNIYISFSDKYKDKINKKNNSLKGKIIKIFIETPDSIGVFKTKNNRYFKP